MSDPFLGEIRMAAFNFAPVGWAFCDGSPMQLAQNQALYALLGVQFGGDGQHIFNLPDLRSRSPIGAICPGETAPSSVTPFPMAAKGGTESYTLQPANVPLPTHTHAATGVVLTGAGSIGTPSNATLIAGATDASAGVTYANFGATNGKTVPLASSFITISPAPGYTPPSPAVIPTRSPYLAVNFIIALQGIYPTRP